MADFNTSKIDGDTVGASEWNQLASIDNFISTSGQTPSTGNLNQTGIAAARYSSGGQFYTDSGIANAYVLSPVSPFKSPVSSGSGEGYFVGMIIRFRAGNANTGASTVNVNSAGVKNLKKEDGTTDLAAGDISINRDSVFRYNGTAFAQVIQANFATTTTSGTTLLPSQITIANNASDANNDIDFSAGVFQVSDGSGQGVAASIETKRLDATWAAGSGAGGLASGLTKSNSTWYHCFKLLNPITGATGSGFDTSASATNLLADTNVVAAGFTKYKRVGSILTDSSGNIRPFYQSANRFDLVTEVVEYNSTTPPTSLTSIAITAPLGIITRALLKCQLNVGGSTSQTMSLKSLTSLSESSINVQENDSDGLTFPSVITNTSSQIQHKCSASTVQQYAISTIGWEDYQL